MTANKSCILKRRLIAAKKSNKPIPAWKRMLPGNTQLYNTKRRHWRRTKLNYHE
jgi:large subunit ribosomal protein L39e